MNNYTEVHSQPQADGDSRPIYHLGTLQRTVTLPRRVVHLERSGPAFLPLVIADQLGASLVAQTLTAAGDVLSAIRRSCFADLIPAWQRLLKVANVAPRSGVRYARGNHFWVECVESVELALAYAESDTALTKWTLAHMLIKGEVERAIVGAEDSLSFWAVKGDAVMVQHLADRIAAYRAFLGPTAHVTLTALRGARL